MTNKEIELAAYWLEEASALYGNHGCNDVEESLFKDWTIEERIKFVKEYHEWNGDPEIFDETFLHLPDFAIMGFLSYKLHKSIK